MANIELDGANKKIKVDSGDLTFDVPGDIILDADGADLVFADGGTNILKITNSSSDVVFQPQVDAKDIIFKQYDGTTVATIEDNGTLNVPTGKLAINATAITSTAAELNILDGVTATATELNLIDGVTATTAELNILDGVTATAAEINLIDGGTARGTTAIADGDGVLINDAGTMRMTTVQTLKTYIGGFDVSSITGATALAEQPAAADEIVLSDAGTLKRLDIKHIQNTPAFMATKTGGDQIVSHNTWTKVTLNNEVFDSDGTFDHSTNYRFTPGVVGQYFIYGMTEADQNLTSLKFEGAHIHIYKNGSEYGLESFIDLRSSGGDSGTVSIGHIIYLDADDYVELYAKARALNDEECRFNDDSTVFGGFRIAGI